MMRVEILAGRCDLFYLMGCLIIDTHSPFPFTDINSLTQKVYSFLRFGTSVH